MANKRVGGGTRGGQGGQGNKKSGGAGGDRRKQGPRQPLSMKRGGPSRQGGGGRNRPEGGQGSGRPGGQPRERSRRSFEPPEYSTQKPAGPRLEANAGGRPRGAGRPEGRPAGRFGNRPEGRPDRRPKESNYSRGRSSAQKPGRERGGSAPSRTGWAGDKGSQRPQRRQTAGSDRRGFEAEAKREPRYEKPAVPGQAPVKVDEPEDRIWGLNPVLELLRSGGRPVDAVWVDGEKGGKQFGEIITQARGKGIPVKFIPKEGLDKMSGGQRHQGVIAAVSPKEYADPYIVAEEALKNKKTPLILILDGIEDPHNLGAIIRTAESSGADGIIIPEHRAAHLTSTVAKASAGALEYMPVAKVPNLAGYIDFLKEKGFWVAGLAGEAERSYTSFDMNVPMALVFGSEGEGIRPLIKKKCDVLLALPMLGKVSSLNVSVSAGIVLYEAVRQQKEKI